MIVMWSLVLMACLGRTLACATTENDLLSLLHDRKRSKIVLCGGAIPLTRIVLITRPVQLVCHSEGSCWFDLQNNQIQIANESQVVLDGLRFVNRATGYGSYTLSPIQVLGGSSLALTNCIFGGIESSNSIVHFRDGSQLYVRDCLFSENSNHDTSGIIQVESADLVSIQESVFRGNHVKECDGGAVSIQNTKLVMIQTSHFVRNYAWAHGGALFVSADSFVWSDLHFLDNLSPRGRNFVAYIRDYVSCDAISVRELERFDGDLLQIQHLDGTPVSPSLEPENCEDDWSNVMVHVNTTVEGSCFARCSSLPTEDRTSARTTNSGGDATISLM